MTPENLSPRILTLLQEPLDTLEKYYLVGFAGIEGLFQNDLEQKALVRLMPSELHELAPALMRRMRQNGIELEE